MQKIQKSKQFVEKMCHLYNSAIKLAEISMRLRSNPDFFPPLLISHNGWRKRKTGSA